MRFLLAAGLVLATACAQETPEGFVSKEVIERLFKATQGGDIYVGELSPLFADYAITEPEGFELLGSTQDEYMMDDGFSQKYARAFFNKPENGNLNALHTYFTENDWTNLAGPQTTVWGFIGPQQPLVSDYGSYCKTDAMVDFGTYSDETLLEMSLEVNTNMNGTENNACEQQMGMQGARTILVATTTISGTVEMGIDIPDLQLSPPATSIALIAEMLPYYPVPRSTIEGIDLPGGWGSRTTLSTTLAPSRVLELYNAQMERAGWKMGRSNADELHDWSEWTFTDKAGQDWLATITVTHHEAYPNIVMPILIVLER